MVRAALQLAEGGKSGHGVRTRAWAEPSWRPSSGRVKWFDATRGFGFLVSDDIDGDVLLHFSVLREHGRRSVPEGTIIECVPVRLERGLQAKRVLSIDPPRPCRSSRARPCHRANARTARRLRIRPARSSRWRSNGSTAFAAMVSSSGRTNRAARTCSCTWKRCASRICPSCSRARWLEARIAPSAKGLTAVELREAGELS